MEFPVPVSIVMLDSMKTLIVAFVSPAMQVLSSPRTASSVYVWVVSEIQRVIFCTQEDLKQVDVWK